METDIKKMEEKERRRGVDICYKALYLIDAVAKKRHFRTNRELKRWLIWTKAIASEQNAKRALWLLCINNFTKRENGGIIVTEQGEKFLRTVSEQRAVTLKLYLDEKYFKDFKKSPRYIKMIAEFSGKGWRRINYRNLQKKSTQSGWISEFLKLYFPDKLNSASFALMRAEEPGAVHEHSKTDEIFIFTDGHGYMEMGEEKLRVPVDKKYLIVVGADTPHKIIPIFRKNKGRFLDIIVVSLPGWESENEYKIGESHPSISGPAD